MVVVAQPNAWKRRPSWRMTGPNSPGIPFLMSAARGLSVPRSRPKLQQTRRPAIRTVTLPRPLLAPRGTALRPVIVVRSRTGAPPLASASDGAARAAASRRQTRIRFMVAVRLREHVPGHRARRARGRAVVGVRERAGRRSERAAGVEELDRVGPRRLLVRGRRDAEAGGVRRHLLVDRTALRTDRDRVGEPV